MGEVRAIGSYETLRVLGEGGMGSVYLARDPNIDRLVAIKVLRDGVDDPVLRARLRREARAAGRLSHPNIVTIFHVDTDAGRPFIVMEYVAGQSLAAMIREGIALPIARKLQLLEGICAGLACAHRAALVHRDLKPANVMIDTDWCPRLLDFGLAMEPASRTLTAEHAVVGTLAYMSPEQLTNGAIDHRTDLFSLAALAFELITGERAFAGDTQQVIAAILGGIQIADRLPGAPVDLRGVITRGLERAPDRRFQSALEMQQAFADIRSRLDESDSMRTAPAVVRTGTPAIDARPGNPTAPARWRRWVSGGAATLVAGTAALILVNHPGPAGSASESSSTIDSTAATPGRSPSPVTESPTRAVDTAAPFIRGAGVPAAHRSDTRPAADAAPESYIADVPTGTDIPVGTSLLVRITSVLDSRRQTIGDAFTGVLDQPILRGGHEVLPAGVHVDGRVERSGMLEGRPFMELSLTALTTGGRATAIRTGNYRAIAPASGEGAPRVLALVIGGTAGAAVGGLLGGATGAIAGGVSGATIMAGGQASPAPIAEYHLGDQLPFRIAEPIHID